MRRDDSPYTFAFAVAFLCAVRCLCARAFCAFSCACTKVGAFSHGLDLCAITLRLKVISLAANGCARGIPYLIRYDLPSNPWSLRCRMESCLKLVPHSR